LARVFTGYLLVGGQTAPPRWTAPVVVGEF
jgi:hypothetical protein